MNLDLAKTLDRVAGRLASRLLAGVDRLAGLWRAPPPVSRVERILLIKYWGLGNWALLRPVVQDLRARHPQAHLTIATLHGNRSLVEDLADDLLLLRTERLTSALQDLLAAVSHLRRRPPCLSIDFEQFAQSGALLARLGGARQRIGFTTGDGARDGLYTVTVPFRRDAHVTRSFRDLAEVAGVSRGPYQPGGLVPTPGGKQELLALDIGPPYVVLHPGSGDNFPGRRWSAAGFAALGRHARERGLAVLVTGVASEAQLALEVAAAVGPGARAVAGRLSVVGLVALLDGAQALASNDTGPVHLASQLGTPVLAFFGPNTPVLYAPLSSGSRSLYLDLPCSPCLTVESYRSSRCRIYTCMDGLSTGRALAAWREVLDARRSLRPERVG